MKYILHTVLAIMFYALHAHGENAMLDSVYQSNKPVIDSILNMRVSEEMIKIGRRYMIPHGHHKTLRHYIWQREMQLLCFDYMYKDNIMQRTDRKIEVEVAFKDSVNSVLILGKDNILTGENVSFAIQHKEILKLDSVQYNYIMGQALTMARRISANYRTNVWSEEMEILKKTLDKQQLQSFFYYKNANKVTAEFDKAWDKLSQAGLTEQLDSVQDASDAVNYMFRKQMIKDMYRYYGTPQKRLLTELDKNMPKMIKLLEGLEKQARVRTENRNKHVGKEFIW